MAWTLPILHDASLGEVQYSLNSCAVSQLDSAWLKVSKNKDTECLRTNYCKK